MAIEYQPIHQWKIAGDDIKWIPDLVAALREVWLDNGEYAYEVKGDRITLYFEAAQSETRLDYDQILDRQSYVMGYVAGRRYVKA